MKKQVFFLLQICVFTVGAISASANSLEQPETFEQLSAIVEGNCGERTIDLERAAFLQELQTKIDENLTELTQKMRDHERFLIDPKKYYIKESIEKAEEKLTETTEQLNTAKAEIDTLRFEQNIEKHAIAVYQNEPAQAKELKVHEDRHLYFREKLQTKSRAIASLKKAQLTQQQNFESIKSSNLNSEVNEQALEQKKKEKLLKLPKLRQLTKKYWALAQHTHGCITIAQGKDLSPKQLQDIIAGKPAALIGNLDDYEKDNMRNTYLKSISGTSTGHNVVQ